MLYISSKYICHFIWYVQGCFVMEKKFYIPASEIKPLIEGRGVCIASDEITIEGKPVGFMYRDSPDDHVDSGWRFFSGDETQQYVDDPSHFELYDLNTIANYDPSIIIFLDSPVMSAFERNHESGELQPVPFPATG